MLISLISKQFKTILEIPVHFQITQSILEIPRALWKFYMHSRNFTHRASETLEAFHELLVRDSSNFFTRM